MEGNPEKVLRSGSGSQIHSQNLVDRISNLPDPILSHILSFLPTKSSVATAILSHRWKFLWTTVPDFDFSNVDSLDRIEESDDDSKIDWDRRDNQIDAILVKFIHFVNRVLLLRSAGSINKFSLVWEAQSISSDVNSWINNAIANNVQDLILNIYVGNLALAFEPSPRIFSCQSLHFLLLKCNFVIHSANVVSLPKLETLKLYSIRFQDEEAFEKLILGCPVLKCLCISTYFNVDKEDTDEDEDSDEDDDFFNENVFKFVVHSTTLRRLKMHVCGKLPDLSYCSIELKTPSLEYLKLQECISRIFLQGSLSSLNEVDFEINPFVIGAEELMEYSCDYVVEAVHAFSCAKHLTLSNYVMQAFSATELSLSTKFERLTKFRMMADDGYWTSLPDCMDFIQCSDSLEVIAFDKGCHCDLGSKSNCWKNPDKVPECLKNSLKAVLFFAFEGFKDEMGIVEYLLKHGSVLELVQIHCSVLPCSPDYKTKFEMLQQISKFSRKSPDCQLEFR